MYRSEFYILPTKYVKKKHAIGYIHEILILDLTDQVISIFPYVFQNLLIPTQDQNHPEVGL